MARTRGGRSHLVRCPTHTAAPFAPRRMDVSPEGRRTAAPKAKKGRTRYLRVSGPEQASLDGGIDSAEEVGAQPPGWSLGRLSLMAAVAAQAAILILATMAAVQAFLASPPPRPRPPPPSPSLPPPPPPLPPPVYTGGLS